ncbi:MAG: hypothetical protein ABR985_03315 [Methanotrichaceae archaeon]|jgi:hypothetical protein
MDDEERRLREESWHREQQHWPWVGDWPQMKNVTLQREQKGPLQSKKPLYPPSYYPEKPVPVECWGCTIESDYRYLPIFIALSGFKRTPPMWQTFRRPDGVLELRTPTGFTLETQTQNAEETATNCLLPNIDDEPQDDDYWIQKAFERFDRPEFNEAGYHRREERARNGFHSGVSVFLNLRGA